MRDKDESKFLHVTKLNCRLSPRAVKLESLIDQIEFELEGLTFASFCIEGDAWTESLKWFQKKSYGFRNELQNELNRLFVTLGI